jgi:carbamoyltransferase
MGLAPYGDAAFFDARFVGNIYDAPNLLYTPSEMLPDSQMTHIHAGQWLQHARTKALELGYDLSEGQNQTPLSRFHKDIAASTQLLFEEQSLLATRALANIQRAVFGSEPGTICLSGGCALNCPSNSRIWRESEFDEIFVPPTCDDSGLAIGSALLMTHNILDLPRQPQGSKTSTSAYLGRRHSQASIDAAVRKASDKIRVSEVSNAPEDAAQALVEDKIVAWYEGRSEIGPRALGHRSILSDPRQGANWKRVNQVKRREEWRPFAPAVLEEKAADWFEGAQLPSPFMLYTAQVKSDQIPAITHVDGSARIQTVDKECGGYRQVIEAFDRKTGVPVVMNTSLNGPGEPIVETPEDALRFIENSGADCLYIGGYKLERADTPEHED